MSLRSSWKSVSEKTLKCTRQRCRVAWKIFAIAALSPECESEMTSLTPRKPRRVSEHKESVQNGSASLGPTATPKTSRSPSVAPTEIITATETMRPACRTFTYVASIHRTASRLRVAD